MRYTKFHIAIHCDQDLFGIRLAELKREDLTGRLVVNECESLSAAASCNALPAPPLTVNVRKTDVELFKYQS